MKRSGIKPALLRGLSLLCGLGLLFSPALGEEEELEIEEVVEYEYLDDDIITDDAWTFPVALSDLDPAFSRLANQEYLLESDFVPDPLVTVKDRSKDGSTGVLKASGSKMQLQETCYLALHDMSEAAR